MKSLIIIGAGSSTIEIIDILFDIYDNCYDFIKGRQRKMTKDYVISKKKLNLVFE